MHEESSTATDFHLQRLYFETLQGKSNANFGDESEYSEIDSSDDSNEGKEEMNVSDLETTK